MPTWISGAFSAVAAVGKAIAAIFGFIQQQQEKQAGEDAQTVADQGAVIKAQAAELKADAGAPTTNADAVKRLEDGTA